MINKLKFLLFELFSLILHFFPSRKTHHFDLIIVRVDALGDYILWLDALEAYKSKYRGKSVLLICADIIKPLADKEPFFTDVMAFDRKRIESDFMYYISYINHLRNVSTTSVIYPVWQRHRIGEIFVYTIAANKKIALQSAENPGIMSRFYDRQYDILVKKPNCISEIICIEDFTRAVISDEYVYGKNLLKVTADNFDVPNSNFVVVSLSASIPQKTWPVSFFAQVIKKILDSTPWLVVLSGAGVSDKEKSKAIKALTQNNKRLLDYVNKTSVVELIYLISKASLVIGNDSAAVHIAAATHVKSICIMHGAHFGRFLPYPESVKDNEYHPIALYHKMDCYGCAYNCKKMHGGIFECLCSVKPKDVIDQVVKLL